MSIAIIQRDISAPAERYVVQHITRRWREEAFICKETSLLQRSNMSIATIQRDISAPAERYVVQHIARRWRAKSCAPRFL